MGLGKRARRVSEDLRAYSPNDNFYFYVCRWIEDNLALDRAESSKTFKIEKNMKK